ncbi:MAG TPA: AAA domain-containing protein, partial [Planctomycetota bacterium]|nr:AAA domain-containing protein [Planctomycetota bacterium]
LYPLSNQALLGDMEDMLEGKVALEGPIESFLRADAALAPARPAVAKDPVASGRRVFADERFVTDADPCQARAVRLARAARGLVIHGPPGTGKSQTIANVVGDHLARGERVLFVCDKRTALDVVHQRITHLGLGQLCAVVHDAERDQRELYRSVRDQLDALTDAKTNPAAVGALESADRELGKLHEELARAERALAERPDGGKEPSFHELAGRWLAIDAAPRLAGALEEPTLAQLSLHERAVREVLERAAKEDLAANPWREAAGAPLGAFLARPLPEWKAEVSGAVEAARAADATLDAAIPAFAAGPLEPQGVARARLARELAPLVLSLGGAVVARWARASATERAGAREQLTKLAPQLEAFARGPLDVELAPLHEQAKPQLAQLSLDAIKLRDYVEVTKKWWSFLAFGKKSAAAPVVARYGLPLTPETAERVLGFVEAVRARALLSDFHSRNVGAPVAEAALAPGLAALSALLAALESLGTDAALKGSADAVKDGLGDEARRPALLRGLEASEGRARALVAFEEALRRASLLAEGFRADLGAKARAGAATLETLRALDEKLGTVEGILRLRVAHATLPPKTGERVLALALARTPAEEGWKAVEKAVLAAEMARRVRSVPALAAIDADGMRVAFERLRAIEQGKAAHVRDAILHRWTKNQQERLLASTGSRLNSAGADLKRRLMLRGEHALKLRPMIGAGDKTDGGDPLFDVRPVWMVSPQTAAQIFPRKALFDVVVFDEASQCRLEEALPVLLRAKRVVIAGDPKQLPPTRFFESAVVQSTDDADLETEQGLFEEQQSEIEDLLAAALNLEVEQSYLDVHYRSRNADLIAFSNRNFYDARLQPIPGHPSRRALLPPVRLVPVEGVYEKRTNLAEARKVVEIVRDLLSRKEPPSIGIACMNLAQRDAIRDALDEAAAQDAAFATALAAARTRQGASSFEGLFVKNLENVQGDERDHMIISTTYGKDAKGRFYRRFGPLGTAGGGRRLNVLVTRARDEVHLVTSIPREVYRALEPVTDGRTPNGAWLLFAYLVHAEELATRYTEESERVQLAQVAKEPRVLVRDTASGSAFARALAGGLARHGVSSQVHWGNDGFCIDLALAHPTRAEDVTIGVLCDTARFERARDKVEWDVFRTRVLEGQGWKLHRVWTPQFVRNPDGAIKNIIEEASQGR